MVVLADLVCCLLQDKGYEIIVGKDILIAKKEDKKLGIKLRNNITLEDLKNFIEFVDKKIIVSSSPIAPEVRKGAKELDIILWDGESLKWRIGDFVLSQIDKIGVVDKLIGKKEIVIKKEISKEEARGISKPLGKADLEVLYIPYFVYDYECLLFEEGKLETRKKSGVIGINALSGQYEVFWRSLREDSDGKKLAPKLTEREALRKAKESVIRENTKVVETRRESEGAVVFEKKEFKPIKNGINLAFRGLYYLPAWSCKSKYGFMLINAVTGVVLERKKFTRPVIHDEKKDVA